MALTWKQLAYKADVLPDLLSPYAVGDLLYADSTTTLAKLADVAVGSYLRSGGVGVAPLWSTLILPNAATAYRLPVATGANTIGELAAVGATGEYLKGNTGAIPSWATLNQAAVAGLTTIDGPSFAHLHLADVAAIYTAAESWIGPSSTAGVYFKGGFGGIGTIGPLHKLHVSLEDGGTNAIAHVMRIEHTTTNTPVAGFGTSLVFYGERSTSYPGAMGYIAAVWTNPTLNTEDADLVFAPVQNGSGAGTERMRITSDGNICIGITAFGTALVKGLALGSGTAPSSFPADMAQMCVKDQAAGNACFHFYTELGQIIKLYQQAALTTALTGITHTAPGTPDYALQDLVQNTGFGFVTKDEGNSLLAVVACLQVRQAEIATILTNNGLTA